EGIASANVGIVVVAAAPTQSDGDCVDIVGHADVKDREFVVGSIIRTRESDRAAHGETCETDIEAGCPDAGIAGIVGLAIALRIAAACADRESREFTAIIGTDRPSIAQLTPECAPGRL